MSIDLRQLAITAVLLFVPMIPLAEAYGQAGDPERAENPLGQFFKGLDRSIKREAEQIEWAKSGKDQFDVRPQQRPEDQRRLQRATELMKQGQWNDAIELLQFLLETPGDAFTVVGKREFRSLRNEVYRLLNELPAEGKRNYENRYAATAQRLLDQARQSQDEQLLSQVAANYRLTPAGRTALRLLADRSRDRGDYGNAVQLRISAAQWEPDARLQQQDQRIAALLLARSGRLTEAELMAAGQKELIPQIRKLAGQPNSTAPDVIALPVPRSLQLPSPANPVLLPRWTERLIERYAIRERIDELNDDLREQNRALLPTITPLVVDDKVAFRTLRSLQVRDTRSGALLWERRMDGSPEEMMTSPDPAFQYVHDQQLENNAAESNFYEQHQVTSLLYRDEIYGCLTSDGRSLYAVEEQGSVSFAAPLYAWQRNEDSSAGRAPWSTNEITAYDLETGRVCWTIGGKDLEESFSRPLAGTFFFGPPVPRDGELYVIGERGGEISLFCLSAQSGELNWSRGLAAAARGLGEDTTRRFWPCLPLVQDGLVVCPTTSGWLIALERMTGDLKWAFRYPPRMENSFRGRSDYSLHSIEELNRRWIANYVLADQGRLVVGPPELPDEFGAVQPMLFCIDLQTGSELWRQPKNDGLYLAGLYDQQVICVGSNTIVARRLASKGDAAWTLPLSQRPSGRGIIINGKLFQPVNGGTLLTIDLKTGKLESETTLPGDNPGLGNLAWAGKQLISVSYEDALAIPASAADSADPASPGLLAMQELQAAQLLLANGDSEAALQKLRSLSGIALPAPLRKELETAEFQALVKLIRKSPGQRDRLLDEMRQLASQPEQQQTLLRLEAEFYVAAGEWESAVPLWFRLLRESPPSTRFEEETREIRIDAWVGGRLFGVFRSLSDEQKDRFTSLLETNIEQLPQSLEVRQQLAIALAFHPRGHRIELELAREAERAGDLPTAILRRRRAADSTDPLLQAEALHELATLYTRLQWRADAVDCWQRLLTLPAHQLKKQGLLNAARESLAKAEALPAAPPVKWASNWEVVSGGPVGEQEGQLPITPVGQGVHQFQRWRMLHDESSQRIRFEDQHTGKLLWSFPLRSAQGMEHHASTGVRLVGPFCHIIHQGMLQTLAWPGESVRWSWTPNARGSATGRLAGVMDRSNYNLQSISSFTSNHLRTYRNPSGYLLAANDHALLLLCRSWVALDPLTGEELWRDKQAPVRAVAHALGSDWFVTPVDSVLRLRSPIDGSLYDDPEIDKQLKRAVLIDGSDLVLLDSHQRSLQTKQEWTLQRVTLEGQQLWSVQLPPEAELTQPDADHLFWFSRTHGFEFVDLHSGARTPLQNAPKIPTGTNRKISVLSDDERFYLFIDEGEVHFVYVNGPSIRVTGTIDAFDRSGKKLWNREITPLTKPEVSEKGQEEDAIETRKWVLNLLVQDFQQIPLLLLVGERSGRRGELYFQQLRIVGIDKRTGDLKCDWSRPTESSGFAYLHVDLWQKLIELRTYHERFFVQPQAESTDQ
ncbi:outer membrane protein assembly factor BamB family protein [Planctomicrobium sp. SH664]|uniref:outer membrane protein assembly factor BamB family protein n=1 Tax=Planctomicrobium sp. SH664 TaxID=3448125 RepID=UPI003F5C7ECF